MSPARQPTDALHRRRRSLALLAALLWLLGFELGPDLHLVMHGSLRPHSHAAAHHDHADTATHGHAHPDDDGHHAHHDDHHARDVEHEDSHHQDDDEAELPGGVAVARTVDPQHGRHDASHRGIAVLVPASPMPLVASAASLGIVRLSGPHASPDDRAPLDARARGPPTAAAARG